MTTEPVFSGEGGEQFCRLARDADAQLATMVAEAADPDNFRRLVDAQRSALRDLAAAAPGEIRPDVRVIAEAYDDYDKALRKVRYHVNQLPADATRELQRRPVQTASERLEAYRGKVCGSA